MAAGFGATPPARFHSPERIRPRPAPLARPPAGRRALVRAVMVAGGERRGRAGRLERLPGRRRAGTGLRRPRRRTVARDAPDPSRELRPAAVQPRDLQRETRGVV